MKTFRKATLADLDLVSRFVNAAYRGDSSRNGWTTEADLLEGQRTDPSELKKLIETPECMILMAENESGELVSCCELKNLPGHVLYFGMLTVTTKKQGAGLGKMLLQKIEAIARERGAKFIQLTALHPRVELIAYYERRGYQKTGRVFPFPEEIEFGVPKVKNLTLLEMQKCI